MQHFEHQGTDEQGGHFREDSLPCGGLPVERASGGPRAWDGGAPTSGVPMEPRHPMSR